jgi:hypothetical protein
MTNMAPDNVDVMRLQLMQINGELLASISVHPDASSRALYDQAMQAAGGQPCQLTFAGNLLPCSDATKLSELGVCDGSPVLVALGQPLLENLAMWLRADDLEVGPVASWRDVRGGPEVLQPVAQFQPVLVRDAFGAHKAVRFGATGPTFFTLPSEPADVPNDGLTVLVAVANVGTPSPEKPPVTSQHDMSTDAHEAFLFDIGEVNPAGYGVCVADQASGSMKFCAHSPTRVGGAHIKPLHSEPGRSFHTIAYRLKFSSEMSLTWNGVEVGTAPVRISAPFHFNYGSALAQHPFTIGAMAKGPSNVARRRFVGDVAELLVYNAPLSNADLAAMETYFERRFA